MKSRFLLRNTLVASLLFMAAAAHAADRIDKTSTHPHDPEILSALGLLGTLKHSFNERAEDNTVAFAQ